MSASNNLEAAAEDIASDVRGVLASKDLDSVPHIKALRQRIDTKLAIARELAAEKSKLAARRPAKRPTLPTPTPTTNRGRSPAQRWPWACWWVCCLAAADLKRTPPRCPSPSGSRRMRLLSLFGLNARMRRLRIAAAEGALAAEDRVQLLRMAWEDEKQRLKLMLVLVVAVLGLTTVTVALLSMAVVVHFWETPHRIAAAWSVAGVWVVLWLARLRPACC
jgi:hypothetical protein